MPGDFEFELDEVVQACVEGRILARKDSSTRENEYLIEYDDGSGHRFRRWFPEREVFTIDDENNDGGDTAAADNVVPLRAA